MLGLEHVKLPHVSLHSLNPFFIDWHLGGLLVFLVEEVWGWQVTLPLCVDSSVTSLSIAKLLITPRALARGFFLRHSGVLTELFPSSAQCGAFLNNSQKQNQLIGMSDTKPMTHVMSSSKWSLSFKSLTMWYMPWSFETSSLMLSIWSLNF